MIVRCSLSLLCLLISCIATSGNSPSVKPLQDNDRNEGLSSESPRSLRKRNTLDENGDLDILYTATTRASKAWFQLTSPSSSVHHAKATRGDKEIKDNNGQVQGLIHETAKKTESKSFTSDDHDSIDNMLYVGCFSTWEKQFTNLQLDGSQMYDDTQFHTNCAKKCQQRGIQMQVVFVKGAECKCAGIYEFNSTLTRPSDCNIPCPVKTLPFQSGQWGLNYPCGGNRAYSVFCVPGQENCNDLMQEALRQQTRSTEEGEDTSVAPITKQPIPVMRKLCAKCSLAECVHYYLYPDFDYFPANSPKQCVEYCSSTISFVSSREGRAELKRFPTKYALLLWWKVPSIQLPICSCVDEAFLSTLEEADESECNMSCPGDPSEICGGIEHSLHSFMTVYCVQNDGDDGEACTEIQTTTEPPTTINPTTDPLDPCAGDYNECNELPYTTETSFPNDTIAKSTTTVITTSTTVSPSPTSTVPPPTTTLRPTSTSTTKASTTTNTPTTTTTMITKPGCNLKCQAYDRRGYFWEVCAGQQAIVRCTELNKNSNPDGLAFWRCSEDGAFDTSQPDVSECKSSWLEEKHEEIKNIQDIEEADTFVTQLAESCKNASNVNSTSKYFGHEIKGITSLVQQTVRKAREFYTGSSEFAELERVIEKAVDLNAFLLQFHDPWKDLPLPEKSIVSTDIITNTEDALFHLSNEAETSNFTRIFTIKNGEANDFLILAESYDKEANLLRRSYEFPPKKARDEHDSYIKLPTGWGQQIPAKQIEIAALSIDSDYISSIMPGQYENLVSCSTLGDEDNADNPKLINGKMISLSLMTAEGQSKQSSDNGSLINRPSISFKGKGVEIVFHHDIEAWGKGVEDVPRYLHDGELPKAVLGSSQCVYWDTKSFSWSSKGCKVIRINRYETVCECNHLTSFAILMDVHRYVGKDFGLELLTLILCPASEVALFISILILSSIGGMQKIRASITTNLSLCLLVGNGLVLFVLDRNYFNMNEGVCMGAAMVTHYVFLCAFMWMLIEGIQLYRMVVHVFDSGRSYIKQFGIFAYGSPLIVIAITATVGYLKGDKPYGGDVYCWLEGPYVWTFMGPVAIIVTINFVILFIALKTAYQVQQSKQHSPVFIMGRIRSYKTWFKGCFSLTAILGLTWAIGFFTIMKSPGGIVAAYLFTILNASQGLFIFFFNCVFNEKVRSFTQRNLSTYLPSWLSSSMSSNPGGNDGSTYGKRPLSSMKSADSVQEKGKKRASARGQISSPIEVPRSPKIPIEKINEDTDPTSVTKVTRKLPRTAKVDFAEARNTYFISDFPVERSESLGTISSLDSSPTSSASDNGHISSDNSQSILISRIRF